MRVLILGGGPSGIIVANYLMNAGIEFKLITKDGHGFQKIKGEVDYSIGQRTMFSHPAMDEFLDKMGINFSKSNLSNLVGVHYKSKLYQYPLQNHMPFFHKLIMYLSYLIRDRRKSKSNNFADWVVGNFGSYLGANVILPHTWKTIKEDLWMIQSEFYGKKVIPIKLFGNKDKDVFAYESPDELLNFLENRVSSCIVKSDVKNIDPIGKRISVLSDDDHTTDSLKFDIVLNTIPLNKLMGLIKYDDDIIQVASNSLRYNNMFVSVMIVPTNFIRCPHVIVYFPERKYLFSKVNINRGNGYTAVVSEVSFRRNDDDLFKCDSYKNKVLERIEFDLKKSGILEENLFTTFSTFVHILNPAYIICNEEYGMYNNILQTWLEHHNIYNIGRFAQWKPHIRIEHSLMRIQELGERVFGI